MKSALLIYIALGLSLSELLGIRYECTGMEIFPKFYGSPFIFKQTSLATSLEYYYSVFGVICNTVFWSVGLLLIGKLYAKLTLKGSVDKVIKTVVVSTLFMLSSFSLAFTLTFKGPGFGEDSNSNAWYWDIEKEADKWGMNCESEFEVFQLYFQNQE